MAVFRLVGLRKNKRTGIWEYRRIIPKALRPHHDSSEFKRSTGTAEKREAERLALPFIAQFKALLSTLEEQARSTPAVQPTQAVPMTLQPVDLRALAGELAQSVLARHALDPAPRPEAMRLNSAIPANGNGQAAPWGTREDAWAGHRFMLLAPRDYNVPATTQGVVTKPAKALLAAKGIALADDQWAAFCDLARDALDGAYGVLQRRARGGTWTDESLAQRFPMAADTSSPVTITGLVEYWKAGKERYDRKTYDRLAKALSDFATFLGHDDATRVTANDLPRWLISLAEGEKKLAAKTINEGYRAGVRTCFAAAASVGALRVDPLASVKFKIKVDATKGAARHPYSNEDAKRLLSATRKEKGALRWLPWLMAYGGERIGEVSQLYREDVRWAAKEEAEQGGTCKGQSAMPSQRGGVYFLRITNEGKGQRLKNAASRREVPLHPAIIAEGFLEFVAKVPAGQFVFPELTTGKYGHKGDGGSRVYRKWARTVVGIKDARLTAHSWRHRFEDQLRHTRAPEEVRDALTGHARQGMGARYGHGHSLATKAKCIAQIPAVRVEPKTGKQGSA